MIKVVLLSVNELERSTAESIENMDSVNNIETLIEAINEAEDKNVLTKDNYIGIIEIYSLSDFADACNDQIINLNDWWVSYVDFSN